MKTETMLALLLCQIAQTIYTLDLRIIRTEFELIVIDFPTALKQSPPRKQLKTIALKDYLCD